MGGLKIHKNLNLQYAVIHFEYKNKISRDKFGLAGTNGGHMAKTIIINNSIRFANIFREITEVNFVKNNKKCVISAAMNWLTRDRV